MKTNKLQKN